MPVEGKKVGRPSCLFLHVHVETTTCSSQSATVLVASLLLYVVFFDLNRFSSI